MRSIIKAVFWAAVFFSLSLLPLIILFTGPAPPGKSLLTEFSVALAFAGLSVLGFQLLLVSRIKTATDPFGLDIVYYFHKQLSIAGFLMVFAHPVILIIEIPARIALLNIFTAPLQAKMGVGGLIALIILVATSLWRLNFKLNYEPWRYSHLVFTVAFISLALVHIAIANRYIGTPLQSWLWFIFGLLWLAALLYLRIYKPAAILKDKFTVQNVKQERGNSFTVELRPPTKTGMRFYPGQFAWLTIWNIPFAMQEHPFSISSSALNRDLISFTIKSLGDFTSTIKDLTPGAKAYVDGPYGAFSCDRYIASAYVFVAGGIGITPIMSMMRTLADRRDKRPLMLFYSCKSVEEVTFLEDLDELKTMLDLKIIYIIEKPPEGWQGESGFINTRLLAKHLPKDRLERGYFICGPPPMMAVVEESLDTLGIPVENVHSERFDLV